MMIDVIVRRSNSRDDNVLRVCDRVKMDANPVHTHARTHAPHLKVANGFSRDSRESILVSEYTLVTAQLTEYAGRRLKFMLTGQGTCKKVVQDSPLVLHQ